MKPIWLVKDLDLRRQVIEDLPRPRYAVWSRFEPVGLEGLFDKVYRLSDLFTDEVFFDALAKVDGSSSLVFLDVGIDICVTQPTYIKEYTKLRPLSLAAKTTLQFDHFAFYFSEKAIYRPFLYFNQTVFDATLQQFYGVGPYKDFDGNRVEKFADVVRPWIECRVKPIPIEVIEYRPTQEELATYEQAKYRLIMVERKGKPTVINGLFDLIASFQSKRDAIESYKGDGLVVANNDIRKRFNVYDQARASSGRPLVFFSSKTLGVDEMSLEATVGAIDRHNDLVRLLNG